MHVKQRELFVEQHGAPNKRVSIRLTVKQLHLKLQCHRAAMRAASARIRFKNAQSALRRSRSENASKQEQEELRLRMRESRRHLEQRLKLVEATKRGLEEVEAQQVLLLGPCMMEMKIHGAVSKGMEIENLFLTLKRNSRDANLSSNNGENMRKRQK